MSIDNVLYRAYAEATGGREGRAISSDGVLDVELTTPKELGGNGARGTNPEQLFAAGYSACFLGAMKFVAARDKLAIPKDPSIEGVVGIGPVPTANTGLNSLEPLTIGYYLSPGSTYQNPEFMATVKEALATLDDKKREDLVRKAWDMTYRDVATISIWNSVSVYSMKKNVDYRPIAHRPAWLRFKDLSVAP